MYRIHQYCYCQSLRPYVVHKKHLRLLYIIQN